MGETLAGALSLLKASCWRSVGLREETQSRLGRNVVPQALILQSWSESILCWLRLRFLICKAEMNRTSLSVEDCEDLQIKAPNTYDDD